MPQYGLLSYWDNRYENDFPEPFDWLFSYKDLAEIFGLLMNKDCKVLIVGCGNAEMSADMHADGYVNQVNMDTCEVVIRQQRERYPDMRWEVADVTDMKPYADNEFDVVLDKSLIDTMLCYDDSATMVDKMMQEIHRVLRTGGRYICLSLHTPDSALRFITKDHLSFYPHVGFLRNPRYCTDKGNQRNRTSAFTVVISDKYPDGLPPEYIPPPLEQCAMNEEQVREMKAHAEKEHVEVSLKNASVDQLLHFFEISLAKYSMDQGWI